MKEYFHLGQFLRLKRIQSGLSQVELARALGINLSQFVSNWERGTCAPPGASLQVLIKILNIHKEDLIQEMLKDSRVMIENKIHLKKRKSTRSATTACQ